MVNRVSGLVLPASMKVLIDDVLGSRRAGLLLPVVAAVVAGTIVHAAASYLLTRLLARSANELAAECRHKLQRHIARLPVAYYDRNKTGTLVARVMNDVDALRNFLAVGAFEFVGSLITAAISLLVLVRTNSSLTALALAFLVPFTFAVRWEFRKFRPVFRKRSQVHAELTGRLTESFSGVRVVKGYHAEERESANFLRGVHRLLDVILQTIRGTSLMNMAGSLTFGCGGALVMYVGARKVLDGSMTLGQLLTFTAFLMLLTAPAMQTVHLGSQMAEALGALDRCREVLRERPEDLDPNRRICLPFLRGEIRFEDVHFSYDPGKLVLRGVSFQALPGTVTALVGCSGAGKSTVTNLIAAFHVAQQGRILVDGVDLSTVRLDSWRTQLGVVLQETFLFDGTIRENVAFARPDASERAILHACRVARVDEFAERFEGGYDTLVGERGVKLSGGQKQRVSIARAILADPKILILDEATSSLDSESEALIQEGLAALLHGRTTFIIAHRLSTIRRADQILVLDAGALVESGTHESLYRNKSRYYELCRRQESVQSDLLLKSDCA